MTIETLKGIWFLRRFRVTNHSCVLLKDSLALLLSWVHKDQVKIIQQESGHKGWQLVLSLSFAIEDSKDCRVIIIDSYEHILTVDNTIEAVEDDNEYHKR